MAHDGVSTATNGLTELPCSSPSCILANAATSPSPDMKIGYEAVNCLLYDGTLERHKHEAKCIIYRSSCPVQLPVGIPRNPTADASHSTAKSHGS